jgi:hypothetical protein
VLALIIAEEVQPRKTRKWVHQAWMKMRVEEEFATLYKEPVEDKTIFSEYFKMSQYTCSQYISQQNRELFEKAIHPLDTSIYTGERMLVYLGSN